MYPKNHENFKNSKPRVQFYWFLSKKKSVLGDGWGYHPKCVQLRIGEGGERLMCTCALARSLFMS